MSIIVSTLSRIPESLATFANVLPSISPVGEKRWNTSCKELAGSLLMTMRRACGLACSSLSSSGACMPV